MEQVLSEVAFHLLFGWLSYNTTALPAFRCDVESPMLARTPAQWDDGEEYEYIYINTPDTDLGGSEKAKEKGTCISVLGR